MFHKHLVVLLNQNVFSVLETFKWSYLIKYDLYLHASIFMLQLFGVSLKCDLVLFEIKCFRAILIKTLSWYEEWWIKVYILLIFWEYGSHIYLFYFSMSYNKDTDEVYAGGIGILEKWMFSGSEVVYSNYILYTGLFSPFFHPFTLENYSVPSWICPENGV